jgi:hypothetical protein
VLGIGPRRDLRLKEFLRQRVGELAADFQVIELFTVSQEIEYEDLHLVR